MIKYLTHISKIFEILSLKNKIYLILFFLSSIVIALLEVLSIGILAIYVGFLSNPDIISQIVKLQSNILTCAPNSSQEVCYNLLDTNFTPDLSILKQSSQELSKIFTDNGWSLPKNNELSMYLFPVNNNINIRKLVDDLLENGLGVICGEPFGYKNAIRLTLPNNYEDLEDIKNILIKVLPNK